MRHKISLSLLLSILLTMLFLYSCGAPSPIRIGVIIDLTGPTKEYGLAMQRGLDLAAAEFNENPQKLRDFLGNRPIELVYFDSKGTRAGARAAFIQLNREGISVLIGPGSSDEALEVAPLAQRTQTLMLTPTASTPNLPRVGGEFVMRNTTSDRIEAVRMVDVCKELGYNNIGIVWQNNEYSTQWAAAFREEHLKEGGEVAFQKYFSGTETDYSAIVEEIDDKKPDAILITGYYQPSSKLIKEIRDMDFYYPIIGPGSFYNTKFFNLVEEFGDGILFTYPDYDPNSTQAHIQEFVNNYKSKYNAVPDIFAATSYDSLLLIAHAYRRAGSTRVTSRELRDNLARTQNFPGISGETSFNPNTGECLKSPKLGVIVEGRKIDFEIDSYKEIIAELQSK